MKRLLSILPFIVFCIFTGCYDIPYLIKQDGEAFVAEELIGKWTREKTDVPSRMTDLIVSKDNGSPWYTADLHEDSGRIWKLKVILHKLGNNIIASSTHRDGSQSGYSIFRIKNETPDTLIFESMDENAPRFNSKEEFLDFLKSDASNAWFVRPTKFNKVSAE